MYWPISTAQQELELSLNLLFLLAHWASPETEIYAYLSSSICIKLIAFYFSISMFFCILYVNNFSIVGVIIVFIIVVSSNYDSLMLSKASISVYAF